MNGRIDGRSIVGKLRLLANGAAAASLAALAFPAEAGVKTTTSTRYYSVGGTTAASLVSYMRSHPIQGDYGNAIANIRPSYSLRVSTKQAGATCRASDVDLSIRFTMTLPKARSTSAMAASTRSAWNVFASYAKSHEERHKAIYIQCANSFVAKARAKSASSCIVLQSQIRAMLEAEKRSCEAKNRAFDRGERARVAGLGLFRMARGSARASR